MMAAQETSTSTSGYGSGSFVTVGNSAMNVQSAVAVKSLPEGKTPVFLAIFLVVNAALGAGLLAFPFSFYMTGSIYVGIALEFFLIFFVVSGVLILVYSADVTQSPTYETAVEAVCGPVVKFFAELCLVAFCFGSNTAYLVVIGDQLEDITDAFSYDGRPLSHYWWMDRRLLITVVAMLFIFPMLFFRRIGILSYTSFLSVLCCFYITLVITVRYFDSRGAGQCEVAGRKGIPDTCVRGIPDIINAIPFICFGYQCHVSSIPVYTDMKQRTFKSFIIVIIPSVFICFTVYTLAGVFGLLKFHPHPEGGVCIASDILRNYCPEDIVVDVARGMLAIVIVTSYPILTFCGRSALDSIFMKLWRFCRPRFRSSSSPRVSTLRYSPPSHLLSRKATASPVNIEEDTDHKKKERFYEGVRLRIESVIWFFISLLLALFVPVISYIISLTGGLAASFIFLFPGLMLLSLMLGPDASRHCRRKGFRVLWVIFSCVIITMGTFIFGLSIAYTVMHDAKLI